MAIEIIDQINQLLKDASESFNLADSQDELYQAKVNFLGKKGRLTDILKGLKDVKNEDRPQVGSKANEVKQKLEEIYSNNLKNIKNLDLLKKIEAEKVDVTLPGQKIIVSGHFHPLTLVMNEMKEILKGLGFDIYHGPEIESDYYNFEALNIPENHPARDMQDTFYVEGDKLLRTHTSPVQIRVMEETPPPISMIAPGAVYRCDSDVTHSPMFHQIEGLVVDKNINMTHLKGVLEVILKNIFSSNIKIQLRPSFFPFTEPSAEVDISCVFCNQKGCRVCSHTGWLEIMGCGMVDPEVFKAVKIDPEKYSGFAFGIGVERVAMLKYGISDIRLFFENDKRFLDQF